MNIVSAVTAARTTSTGSWEDEKGAQSLKVRACMRTVSATVHLLVCSPACCHACRALAGYPTLIVTFFDYESRTTRQAAGKLAERLRRVRTLGPSLAVSRRRAQSDEFSTAGAFRR